MSICSLDSVVQLICDQRGHCSVSVNTEAKQSLICSHIVGCLSCNTTLTEGLLRKVAGVKTNCEQVLLEYI